MNPYLQIAYYSLHNLIITGFLTIDNIKKDLSENAFLPFN